MASGLLSLKWNNHQIAFTHVLSTLRLKESFSDVTLACDGELYAAHKLVLSTCSEYFYKMFERTNCKHPVIVLKDIKSRDLESLLNYMYKGEVSVLQQDLAEFIKAAECLRIKGLAESDNLDNLDVGKSEKTSKRSQNDSKEGGYSAKRHRSSAADSVKHSTSLGSELVQDVAGGRWPSESSHSSREKYDGCRESSSADGASNFESPRIKTEPQEYYVDDPLMPTTDDMENETKPIPYLHLAENSDGQDSMDMPDQESIDEAGDFQEKMYDSSAGEGGPSLDPENVGEGVLSSTHLSSQFAGGPSSVVQHETQRTSAHRETLGAFHSKLQCPYCPYRADHRSWMERHVITHTGERPYACQHCSYRASRKHHLISHSITKHFDQCSGNSSHD